MSKASDDLKKMLHSMYLSQQVRTHHHRFNPEKGDQPPKPEPKAEQSLPVLPKDDSALIYFAVAGGSCLIGLLGALLSYNVIAGLGAVGSLIGVAGVGLAWQKSMLLTGQPGEGGSSDAAVEIIKRKSVEMERDRLKGELRDSLRSFEKMNERMASMRDETVQIQAQKAEWIAIKEKEILQQVERDKEKLQHELDAEKENVKRTLLEQQRLALDTARREAAEREKMLEQSAFRESQQLKQELANREKSLSDLSAQIVSLQGAIDRATVASPKELAEHMSTQNKAFDEERKEFQRRYQAQEQSSQAKMAELKALHARDRQELEKKLDQMNADAMKLQEALDRKVASTSLEVSQHIDKADKAYEAQREELQKKFREQESAYEKKLEEQQEKFDAQRLELLAACESFLRELEAREDALDKREQKVPRPGEKVS